MSEEIKVILEEIRFKAGIYRDHERRGLSFNDEEKNCALLLDYIQQKENQIKEIERLKIIEEKYKDSQLYIHDFKEEIEKLNNIINKAIEKINDYKIYCENNKGFTEYTDIEIEAIEPVISKLEDILKEVSE